MTKQVVNFTNTSSKTSLNDVDPERLDDLYNWLEDIKLSRPKKNLARDFSDGMLMAELMKQFFPRHVELNNYRPANAFGNKMKNWLWLNDKVFKVLGIGQDMRTLKSVASIDLAELERLLLQVKDKVEEQEELKRKAHRESLLEMEKKLTPISQEQYDQISEELQNKSEEVSILQAKVGHLEAMLELKDQRIDDLTVLMKKCTCQPQI